MFGRNDEHPAIRTCMGRLKLVLGASAVFAACGAYAQDRPLPPEVLAAIEEQAENYDPLDIEPAAEVTTINSEREVARLNRADEDFTEELRQLRAAGRCENPTPEDAKVCNAVSTARSFNSIAVAREAAPFQVQLVFSEAVVATGILERKKPNQRDWERRHVCGGSLVAPDWVLTAAHCLQGDDPGVFAVRLDVDDISRSDAPDIPLRRFIVHPDYCQRTPGLVDDPCTGRNQHDLALLQLDLSNVPAGFMPEVVPLQDPLATPTDLIVSAHLAGDDSLALVMQDRSVHRVSMETGKRTVWLERPATTPVRKVWSGPGWIVRADQRGATLLDLERGVRHRQVVSGTAAAALSPGGRWFVAAGEDGRVRVLDIDTRTRAARGRYTVDPDFPVAELLFSSPDNVRVRSNDDRETVFDLTKGSVIQRLTSQLPGKLVRLPDWIGVARNNLYARNGQEPIRRYFAQPGLQLIEQRGEIFMQTAADATPRRIGNTGLLHANLAASPNAKWIVALGPEGDMEVRSSNRIGRKYRTRVGKGFYDKPIATLRDNRRFLIWDPEGLSEIRSLPKGETITAINHGLPVTDVRVIDDDRLLSYNSFGTVDLWDMRSGKALARVHHGDQVDGAAVSGDRLLSWSRTGRVRVWDAASGKPLYHHLVRHDVDGSSKVDAEGLSLARVQTIPLGNQTDLVGLVNRSVKAFGWGKTASRGDSYPSARLRVVGLKPLRWDECFARSRQLTPAAFDPNAFCAAGEHRKTCTGDSGGPVTEAGRLVGIVSRGSGGCRADGEPTTFVMVGRYADWIRGTICRPGSSPASGRYPICAQR